MFGVGHWELIALFVIVLLIFGPKSLPKISRSLGKGIRDFKDAAAGLGGDEDDEDEAEESKKIPEPSNLKEPFQGAMPGEPSEISSKPVDGENLTNESPDDEEDVSNESPENAD